MLAEKTLRLVMIVAGGWLAAVAPTLGQDPDCPPWEQRHPVDAPSPRHGHAMAYDSARKVTVLFGGRFSHGADPHLGDTWEWDGFTWRLRSTVGPPPRYRTAMAYDDSRGVVVLFGGVDGAYFGDTWEWDGVAWALRSQTGPSPRYDHALAYDSARGVTVLFGGYMRHYEGDTWEWDGLTWSLRSNAGPAPRRYHSMAYDARRHVTVLYGGVTDHEPSTAPAETWEWDGHVWQRRSWGVPGFRAGHVMAYDSGRGATLLFSGFSDSKTWAWDGTTWTLLSETGPASRQGTGMAHDSVRAVTVLFGGIHGLPGLPADDTWELPSCPFDSDDDGVPDDADECDHSNLSETVVIDGCDSDVGNRLFEDGCTMADRIAACAEQAEDHRDFKQCVKRLTKDWVRKGLLTPRERRAIRRCAAEADIPPGNPHATREGEWRARVKTDSDLRPSAE